MKPLESMTRNGRLSRDRRDRGMCSQCETLAEPKRSMCKRHLEITRRRVAAYRSSKPKPLTP